MSDVAAAARLRGIEKRYGSVQALRGADLLLGAGEVHALLGENGAGKTTLMQVLFGLAPADAGDVEVAGRPVLFRSPRQAIAAGIGMVHQHFTQVAAMSVAENVALGQPGWRYRPRAVAEAVRRVSARAGLPLEPDATVADLPLGARQRLEIIKALARDARILILDEPTAVLAPAEVDDLFRVLRRLASEGVAIAFITHKLREVASVADRVTVLRGGETVLSGPAAEWSAGALAQAMIGPGAGGRLLAEALERQRRPGPVDAAAIPPRLRVTGLSVPGAAAPAVRDVSFELPGRQITGIAAVEGNGQRELLRAVAGLVPHAGGIEVPGGPAAFVPEDRQREGLILDFDLADNLALGLRGGFWLDRASVEGLAAVAVDEFGIRASDLRQPVRTLSGGNQQKLVLARELGRRPALILAENPTRGLDLAASADVHERLRRAADGGASVLFTSNDLDEVLAIADRVAVMVAGRWRWVADDERTRERVGALMLGAA